MNMGKIIRDAVGHVAPTVAGAALGPRAGHVVRRVSEIVTGRPDAPSDELAAALENPSPETLNALAALEAQEVAREKVHAEDRANARAMAVEMADPFVKWFAGALGVMFFGMLVLLCYVEPPQGSESIVFGGVGTLATAFIASVTYFFGSSIGSKAKTAIMGSR